jgi:antitoxin component YwqK of YwqJK toxin-antitoxin module
MAPLVQYRNRLIVLFLTMVIWGAAYAIAQLKTIPSVWVNSTDSRLIHQNGILYYNRQAFSGWVFSNFPNGDRARETSYYEGKEEGIMKSWYADKSPEQERLFVNGKKEGIHRGWWPNGNPKFEYQFKADEHNGIAKEWFVNNKLYRCFHYTNGHEEGLQQLWWTNGTVRANYVVKAGVQYGLIGRKFCRNTIN